MPLKSNLKPNSKQENNKEPSLFDVSEDSVDSDSSVIVWIIWNEEPRWWNNWGSAISGWTVLFIKRWEYNPAQVLLLFLLLGDGQGSLAESVAELPKQKKQFN